MSDPQTNLDIEDVLSSIRRLVSEQPALVSRRTSRPRLILTPDRRVDVPEPESAPAPESGPHAAGFEDVPPVEPSLEDRIAELEQAIAATAAVWEPDEGDEGFDPDGAEAVAAVAAARMAPAGDDASTAADTGDGNPPQAGGAQAPGLMLDDDEAIFDEEMLRDLVAEFVRQELQGALGERITRNVRKLVRAEVQRALAAREFD